MAFRRSIEIFECQVEQEIWTDFSHSLNKFCHCASQRKSTFQTSTVVLWWKTNCAETPRWRNSSLRCRQNFPPLSAKCAGYHVFESREASYGSRQVGVGTKTDPEMASHVFFCSIESRQPQKNNFEN